MNGFEIAAVIGALAWLLPLIKYIRSKISKPTVRIITQVYPEIGFTTFGPIFNLGVAFAVESKDVVISNIRVKIRHEDGEEKMMNWEGVVQTMAQLRAPDGTSMPWEKENTVLAVKLNQKDIEERFIRFQERAFHESKNPFDIEATKAMARLQSEESPDYDGFLKSTVIDDLRTFLKQWFNWKAGQYEVEFILDSPDSIILHDAQYLFDLTPVDIARLQNNLDCIDLYLENIIKSGLDTYKAIDPNWSWVNPRMKIVLS